MVQVFDKKINIAALENILSAAKHLQEAGEVAKAKEVLLSLADAIKEQAA